MKQEYSDSLSGLQPAPLLLPYLTTSASLDNPITIPPSPTIDFEMLQLEKVHEEELNTFYRFEAVVQAVVPSIFGLIALLGLVGNLLVIMVVISSSQMRNTTNVLIFNLAMADLVFIIICVPLTAVGYSITTWPFGDVVCKIYQYVIYVTAYASVYTLALMSLDRYLAVVHPIHSMTIRTQRNVTIAVLIAWITILVLNYNILIEHKTVNYNLMAVDERSSCMNFVIFNASLEAYSVGEHVYHTNDNSTNHSSSYSMLKETNKFVNYPARRFYALFFAFGYVLPLSLVVVLYGLMVRRLLYGTTPGDRPTVKRADEAASCDGTSSSGRSNQTGATDSTRGSGRGEKMKAKRRVTRLVIVVVVTFALCWLPIHLIFILQFFSDMPVDEIYFAALKIAFSCLAYTNSCVNPFLYAFLSDNFRKSFRRVLGCPPAAPGLGPRRPRKSNCCMKMSRIGESKDGRNGVGRSGLFQEERLLSGNYRDDEARRAVAAAAANSTCSRRPLEPRPATIPLPTEMTRFTSLITDMSTARGSLSPGSVYQQSQPNSPDTIANGSPALARHKQRSRNRHQPTRDTATETTAAEKTVGTKINDKF